MHSCGFPLTAPCPGTICPASKEGGCSKSFSSLPQAGTRDLSHRQHKVDVAPSANTFLSWDLPGLLHFLSCSAAEKEERRTM